jgi:hypothetical protein
MLNYTLTIKVFERVLFIRALREAAPGKGLPLWTHLRHQLSGGRKPCQTQLKQTVD